jgi:hypothetical protein
VQTRNKIGIKIDKKRDPNGKQRDIQIGINKIESIYIFG